MVVVILKDYTIQDAINIIYNCDYADIKESRHYLRRNSKRINDLDLIQRTILNKPLVGILKQDYNKFNVFYEQEYKPAYDLNIIILLTDNEELELLTIMENPRSRRERKACIQK